MAEKENCARVTRSMKRRAEAAMGQEQPATKKRVVLGELHILQNAVVPATNKSSAVEPQVQKRGAKAKAKKELPEKKRRRRRRRTLIPRRMTLKCVGLMLVTFMIIFTSSRYWYLRMADPDRRPLPDYMTKVQKDITSNMRGILVDWLVEVAEEYKLLSDTLFLTVLYIDRYLSLKALDRKRLQLWVFLQCSLPQSMRRSALHMWNNFVTSQIIHMIRTRRFARVTQESYKDPNLQLEFLGYYLAELSLLEYECVKLCACNNIPDTNRLDLRECVLIIHDLHRSKRGATLKSIRGKYKSHKFKCVATISSPPEVPTDYFEDLKE
ncbi:putative cyclin-A3-1 [Prunus yedoensis var. nudiflora]|uniref:B-like cyclin n=1 Tax=Prunus yedoensis var. nudiflora TaxID=2094558 RepID=A0A314XR46_PRUYE|nr:putative cyclin-A3-1 [Prunus yedoensis var. nudiflora]